MQEEHQISGEIQNAADALGMVNWVANALEDIQMESYGNLPEITVTIEVADE